MFGKLLDIDQTTRISVDLKSTKDELLLEIFGSNAKRIRAVRQVLLRELDILIFKSGGTLSTQDVRVGI
jgi:hypothetical protein